MYRRILARVLPRYAVRGRPVSRSLLLGCTPRLREGSLFQQTLGASEGNVFPTMRFPLSQDRLPIIHARTGVLPRGRRSADLLLSTCLTRVKLMKDGMTDGNACSRLSFWAQGNQRNA